jgi:hypothetical protein
MSPVFAELHGFMKKLAKFHSRSHGGGVNCFDVKLRRPFMEIQTLIIGKWIGVLKLVAALFFSPFSSSGFCFKCRRCFYLFDFKTPMDKGERKKPLRG